VKIYRKLWLKRYLISEKGGQKKQDTKSPVADTEKLSLEWGEVGKPSENRKQPGKKLRKWKIRKRTMSEERKKGRKSLGTSIGFRKKNRKVSQVTRWRKGTI